MESGAGEGASIPDEKYINVGAKIGSAVDALGADVVLKVRPPGFNQNLNKDEVDLIKEDATLVSFLQPAQNKELVDRIRTKGIGIHIQKNSHYSRKPR